MPVPVSVLNTIRSTLAYLALLAGVLAFLPGAGQVGAVCVALAIALGWRDLRRMSVALLALAVLAGLLALLWAPSTLIAASENMTGLAALILTVMLLASVMGRSRDLGRIAADLFAGRPLTRYYSLALGAGLLSVPLNFGSVGVLGSMVGNEVRRGGDCARTRNAVRAVLRGFGTSPITSPLSISVVLAVTVLPDLQVWELISLSFPLALLYLAAGALFREPEIHQPVEVPAPSGKGVVRAMPWLRFLGIIALICLGVFALSGPAGLAYSHAVMLSCLGAVLAGSMLKLARGRSPGLPSMAPVTNELVIVGGSAFLGALISAAAHAQMGPGFGLPWGAYPVLAFTVPWFFYLMGLVGFNPIVSGTLTGGVLGPIWPDPAMIGLAIGMVCGWGVTATGSPYAANSLLMERLTGYRAHTVALRWNVRFALVSLTVASATAAILTVSTING